MKYEPPRVTPVSSMLDQAFGTTCGDGSQAGGGDICITGSTADPGVCSDGNRAFQGQCGNGDRALGGVCNQGSTTGQCTTGPTAFMRCTPGSSAWMGPLTTE